MTYSIAGGRLRLNNRNVELIQSPYRSGGFTAGNPQFLVMHYTYGATGRSSAEWFRSPNNRGSSAQVVVDRDGSVLQCVSFDEVSWHAGQSTWRGVTGLNRHAIGIELANWGVLQRRQGGWTSHTGVLISDPVLAAHKNGNPSGYGPHEAIGWEPYPEAQFEAAVEIARVTLAAYPTIEEIIGHDDISVGRKWDPGPAFDMDRFRIMVLGGRAEETPNEYRVAPASGLNLRSGPGTDFSSNGLLPQNTRVMPIETSGTWYLVTVLNTAGAAVDTGWVHSAYLH